MLIPEDLVYLWEFFPCVDRFNNERDFEHSWEVFSDCLIISVI